MEDRIITIAEGKKRNSANWKTKKMLWSTFVAQLSQSKVTDETHDEYMRMSKDKQGEIKDVGGFVGGEIKDGRRTMENMINRTLLTFDLDEATPDTWDAFAEMTEYEAVCYSTHKSTLLNPRLRIIIPLDRPCSADEFEAVARRVAGTEFVFDEVDPASFRFNQLMYKPSHPKDQKPLFYTHEGKPVCVDDILASYADWRDQSQWRYHVHEEPARANSSSKMQNPLEKSGLIGAFCETYSVTQAMETFLPGVYTPTDTGNRYTFTGGSTFGGVIVYDDDLFMTSHHATDPANGSHNAFDMVRLHKFGYLDTDGKTPKNINDLPSVQAMLDFVSKDREVSATLTRRNVENAQKDFAESPELPESSPEKSGEDDYSDIVESSATGIQYSRKGAFEDTIGNYSYVLRTDPQLRCIRGYNEFRERIELSGPVPWNLSNRVGSEWDGSDDAGLRDYFQRVYKARGSSKNLEYAFDYEMARRAFHPVREYLNNLKWDGKKRVDTLLCDYFGAANNRYVKTVTRKTLVGAVKRIYEPGCKHDTILVLISLKQGIGKSQFLQRLGKYKWFSDSITTFDGKDAFEQLNGNWILEIPENYVTSKTDANKAKAFISATNDRYRPAYGRRVLDHPRSCLFFITSNDRNILKDDTGNRRYLPVDLLQNEPVLDVFTDFTEDEVDQVWAEAKELYLKGETNWLNPEENRLALVEQEAHTEDDSRLGPIIDFLDRWLPQDWESYTLDMRMQYLTGDGVAPAMGYEAEDGLVQRDTVCAREILFECFNKKDYRPAEAAAINKMMDRMPGWKRMSSPRRFKIYGSQRGYVRCAKD